MGYYLASVQEKEKFLLHEFLHTIAIKNSVEQTILTI